MCSPWKSNPLFTKGLRVPPTLALVMFKRELLAPALLAYGLLCLGGLRAPLELLATVPSRYGLFCLGGLRAPLENLSKGGGLLFPVSEGALARLGELLFPISCGMPLKFIEGF